MLDEISHNFLHDAPMLCICANNFVNHTLWEQGDTKLREMILEERRLLPKNNLLDYTDEICKRYKLPPVSTNQLEKKLVKRRVKLTDKIDNWLSNLKSLVTENVGPERTRQSTNFYVLPKRHSQSLIAYHAGAFTLKTSWGEFHKDQGCLAVMCDGMGQTKPHTEMRLLHNEMERFFQGRLQVHVKVLC